MRIIKYYDEKSKIKIGKLHNNSVFLSLIFSSFFTESFSEEAICGVGRRRDR